MEADIDREVDEIEEATPFKFPDIPRPNNNNNAGFWADSEEDELGQVFDDDDDFQADDMTTPAHAQLDLHRDMREYQRRIAWDMPLLGSTSAPPNLTVTPIEPTTNKTPFSPM